MVPFLFVLRLSQTGIPTAFAHLMLVMTLVVTLVLLVTTVGDLGSWSRVLRDWGPFLVLLVLYELLRSLADEWSTVHVMPQVAADKALFGGAVPTVSLQQWLYTPGQLRWFDFVAFIIYVSHFFVPLIVLGVLWKLDHARFRKFSLMFIALTFGALLTYALFPAAPPWLASKIGSIEPTTKIINKVWIDLGLRSGTRAAAASDSLVGNPVAAIPSLHAAYPFLLLLFFWGSTRRLRLLLVAYAVAMGAVLVYGAEHYVVDILLGWMYAAAVAVGAALLVRYGARRKSPEPPILQLTPRPVCLPRQESPAAATPTDGLSTDHELTRPMH